MDVRRQSTRAGVVCSSTLSHSVNTCFVTHQRTVPDSGQVDCIRVDQTMPSAISGAPVGRAAALPQGREESPGSREKRWRLTAAGGDPRESATESKPPGHAPVRVKGCGKSAPRCRQRQRQGKPHREQNRIGTARAGQPAQGSPPGRPGWLHEAGREPCPRGMAATSALKDAGHTEPGLQADWIYFLSFLAATRRFWADRPAALGLRKDHHPDFEGVDIHAFFAGRFVSFPTMRSIGRESSSFFWPSIEPHPTLPVGNTLR